MTITSAMLPFKLTTSYISPCSNSQPALEVEIDRLVYALYGLTDEDIVVVEGKPS